MNELLAYIETRIQRQNGGTPGTSPLEDLLTAVRGESPRLADAVEKAVRCFYTSGDFASALRLLDLAFRVDPIREDLNQQATLFYSKGVVLRCNGDLFESIDALTAAKVRFEISEDLKGLCRTLNGLGVSYCVLRQWTMGERCYTAARDIARSRGYAVLEISSGHNLAVALSKQGRWRESLGQLWGLLGRVGSVPNEHLEANIRLQIAVTYRHLGFPRRSVSALRQSLRQVRRSGFRRNEAIAHEFLGDCYLDLGNHKSALKHYKDALKIGLETAPEGEVVCEAYRRLAEVYYACGEIEPCENAIAEGWRICDHLQDDFERVGLLRVKAGLALEKGDLDASDRLFREAVSICVKRGFRSEEALTLEYQAFAHQATDRPETAERYLTDAMHLYEELRLRRLALRVQQGRRALSRKRPPRRVPSDPAREAKRWERFGILTRSRLMLRVLDQVERVASSPLPVLVMGESGVGKELVAHALHALSGREGTLVDINCPAIPETMLESELFGSRKGAFTGAENRPGLVAGADGGSLFLDEIGAMPHGLQAKLLRFIESSTYRSVGGREKHTVDVRVISATNCSLVQKVATGDFRRDLYHRLAGVVIEIPPLRRRPEDLELLGPHFLARILTKTTAVLPVFDEAVLRCFRGYGWPGNIRELKHVVEGAAVRLGSQKRITLDLLPEELRESSPRGTGPNGGNGGNGGLDARTLRKEIAYHGGSVMATARALGVSRQFIYRRVDEMGIDLDRLRAQ